MCPVYWGLDSNLSTHVFRLLSGNHILIVSLSSLVNFRLKYFERKNASSQRATQKIHFFMSFTLVKYFELKPDQTSFIFIEYTS
jgi:hypothetical protein